MGFINGDIELLYFKIDGIYTPIGCLTSNSFNEEVDMLNTTTRQDAGWESSRPTMQRYSISFAGLVTDDINFSNVVSYASIRNLKRQRTLIDWKISRGNGYDDYGQAYITNVSDSAEVESFVSFEGSMVGYGSPSNDFYTTLNSYIDRVTTDNGEIENEPCLKAYIENNK